MALKDLNIRRIGQDLPGQPVQIALEAMRGASVDTGQHIQVRPAQARIGAGQAAFDIRNRALDQRREVWAGKTHIT